MNTAVVTGPRSIKDYRWVEVNIFRFLDAYPTIIRFIHGNAIGVDILSDRAVRKYRIEKKRFIVIHPVKPNYRKYGDPAPFIRNKEMVDDANICLALHNGISTGTQDTINHAKRKGIPIIIVLYPNYFTNEKEIDKWI
jgi:hypothetical protein